MKNLYKKDIVCAFDIVYYKDEKDLRELFEDHELSTEKTLMRVTRLNALYHTHLSREDIEKISEFLSEAGLDFENEILAGKIDAVKEITDHVAVNRFVFATKYCSFVNPKDYPIYDSLVAKALTYYVRKEPFLVQNPKPNFEKIRKERNYQQFKHIVGEFIRQYNLAACSYKDIDKFLWLVGKNMQRDVR